ncbi:MAG: YgfZ/GcvT domain-containing protein [Geminicoccaceae bacterium]
MTDSFIAELPNRAVLRLRGAEHVPFLQGLVTCDVAHIEADQAVYGALLTPQGKFLYDFFIAREGDSLLLETEAARFDELLKRLTMYRLRAKVDLIDERDAWRVYALVGQSPNQPLPAGSVAFDDPRLGDLGARALVPANAEALPATTGFDAYDRHRLALGVPDGSRDLEIDKAILLENGFDELHGVAFDKGCFVGQELTARTKHRGLIRKRLLPVRIDGMAPDTGTTLTLDDKEAGVMRSRNGDLGLALLRLERIAPALAGQVPLSSGDTRLWPYVPDWMRLPEQRVA